MPFSAIKSYFNNLPTLRAKMSVIIVGVTSITLLSAYMLGTAYDFFFFKSKIQEYTDSTAAVTAYHIAPALEFSNLQEVNAGLQALAYQQMIDYACVYKKDGHLFAAYYSQNGRECGEYLKAEQGGLKKKRLFALAEIQSSQKKSGYLLLVPSSGWSTQLLGEKQSMATAIILLSLLVAYFLSFKIQGLVTAPLLHLSALAAQLASTKNYSLRAAKTTRDEIGFLVDAFNDMLSATAKHEAELKEQKQKAEEARYEADSANHLKSQFLATMSHEIRTPLNGVIGMTELLIDSKLTFRQKNFARTIISSAESLLEIINDILDFSKIEAGRLELEPLPLDLQGLVDDVADLLSIKARDKGVELIVRYAPAAPRYVVADAVRVRQILLNLVSNAIKFTDKGYILVTVEALNTGLSAANVRLSVKDTGIGIAPEVQERIFEKFSQADASTTRKYGGTGLGLSICRQLAELMNGRIGLNSRPQRGSTFWVELYLPENEQAAIVIPSYETLRGKRVLAIDDVAVNGDILVESLSAIGVDCNVTNDPATACALLEKAVLQGNPYHFALIDFLMPIMNGEQLAKKIKENTNTQATKLVMLTSASARGYTKRFAEAGFAAFLNKPIRAVDLYDTLAYALQQREAGEGGNIISIENLRHRSRPNEDIVNGMEVQFNNPRILLVEDNKTNQAIIRQIMEQSGCSVVTADNGAEALRMMKEIKFNLVLMDCEMPEMDGYEATSIISEMKRDNLLPEVSVIAVTANASQVDKERCLEAGMSDYLAKPVRKRELLAALSRWLPDYVEQTPEDVFSFEKYSVLLVEDNKTNFMLAHEILSGFGFVITAVENGSQAVEKVMTEEFDVVLMDLHMPVMDGLEATQKIREFELNTGRKQTPIIAMTANTMRGDREMCLNIGMNDYLSKPIRKASLKSILIKWLSPAEKTEEAADAPDRSVDILEYEILENYQGVMEDAFISGINTFLFESRNGIESIRQSWKTDKTKSIYLTAHALKSAAATIGAMELAKAAERMEVQSWEAIQAKTGVQSLSFSLITQLENAFFRLAPQLDAIIRDAHDLSYPEGEGESHAKTAT